MDETGDAPAARTRRRDAVLNRERIVDAAVALFAERGFGVALSEIADAAGVGIGTFYRSFPDRNALLEELAIRAYAHLEAVLVGIADEGLIGLVAIRRYLLSTVEVGDRLVLPLHGAPPLVTPEAVAARGRIHEGLETFLDQARAAGAVLSDVNATDVILCSSLMSRPARRDATWQRAFRRHVEFFVAGLHVSRATGVEPVTQDDIEDGFRRRPG